MSAHNAIRAALLACLTMPTGCSDPVQHALEPVVADAMGNVAEIIGLLERQAAAWNGGDIDGFMDAYERSDTLTFCAGGKTTRGWTATRDRYRAKYDTPQKMGRLTFSDLEFQFLGERTALVLGRWKLDLVDKPAAGGNFSLVLTRSSGGSWRIVHDHTSSDPQTP